MPIGSDFRARALRIGRHTATAVVLACAGSAIVTAAAAAQTGGAQFGVTPDPVVDTTVAPPPSGKVGGPVPRIRRVTCKSPCRGPAVAGAGSTLILRGRRFGRKPDSVVFLGQPGDADDATVVPKLRRKDVATVIVPAAAISGPVALVNGDGAQSAPSSTPVVIDATLSAATAAPGNGLKIIAGVQDHRVFFDGQRPARLTYAVRDTQPVTTFVELVRVADGVPIARFGPTVVAPNTPQTITWDGRAGGQIQAEGRYTWRIAAQGSGGARAVSAQAGPGAGSGFEFLRYEFPIRGPHNYGEFAAAFGGGRGHQGQDVFAACGTPLVAARGGVVKFKQFHGRAGHYIVIDTEGSGVDMAYMHMRDEALVNKGDRVRTGQLIGFVGDTGRASGCHLHFEMWSDPGWYSGGQPLDPKPDLVAWDRAS